MLITYDWMKNVAGEELSSAEQYCSNSDLFFRVIYEQQGGINDLIIEGQHKASSTLATKGILGQIIPWILGLLSAVVGGWLTHRLTVLRERENDRVSRGTKQYDALMPAFRDFLQAWGANPVPDTLQAHFSDLESKVILDPEIVQSYRKTYKILADQALSIDRKREAAIELDRHMRAYVQGFHDRAIT